VLHLACEGGYHTVRIIAEGEQQMNGRYAGGQMTRRRALGLVGGGAAAALLAACAGRGDKGQGAAATRPGAAPGGTIGKDRIIATWELPDETAGAVPGGVYRSVTASEVVGSFDPFTSTSFTTQALAATVYETLLENKTGPGIDPSLGLEVVGRIAEKYEILPEATQVTFKIRPGVRFHPSAPVNGRLLEMEDLRQSLTRFLATSPYRATLLGILDRAEYPDGSTLVLKLKFPYAPTAKFFADGTASFWVMPKEAAGGGMDPATQAIGTNFRVLDRFEPSVTFEYRKHTQYWRPGAPLMDRWHYPIIPEYAQRYAQFKVGNVFEFTPRRQEVLVTRKDVPNALMFKTEFATNYGLMWFGLKDFQSMPWRDERVRRAISMMIDRGKMRAYFSGSDEFKDAGLPQDVRWFTHIKASRTAYWLDPERDQLGPASQYFKFNVAEAKKLLAAAGYGGGFELPAWYTDYEGYGADHAERVQITLDMLQQAGLRIKHNRLEYQPYLSQVYRMPRDFVGIAMGPEFTYAEVDLEIYNWFHSKGDRFKGLADPQVDQLIERQRVELDEQKRTAILHEFQRFMAEKMYAIPWDGSSSGFTFRYPWVKNAAWPQWNVWLAPDTPRRNG
jgi:peptide/nickel transport system substrate-binding protein